MTDSNPEVVADSDTRRAEATGEREEEEGRQDLGERGPAQRPEGTSSARDVTGVDPQDPVTGDGTWAGGGEPEAESEGSSG